MRDKGLGEGPRGREGARAPPPQGLRVGTPSPQAGASGLSARRSGPCGDAEARRTPGLSSPGSLPAPHLRRQQARRAQGLGARAPLQGGLLGRVPQPPHRVLQPEGGRRRRRRLGGRLRLRHLLQDPPQLLGAQRGHAHGAKAPGGRSPAAAAAAAALAAALSLRLRARHGGRRGDSNRGC